MEQKDWKELGKIVSSSYKRVVLESLSSNELTPKAISRKTGISINHISNILKELKKSELVLCLNEDLKKGRIYQITEKGKRFLEVVKKLSI